MSSFIGTSEIMFGTQSYINAAAIKTQPFSLTEGAKCGLWFFYIIISKRKNLAVEMLSKKIQLMLLFVFKHLGSYLFSVTNKNTLHTFFA